MQYIISFIEGVITFISPCMLPMLPIYVSYFAGGKGSEASDSGRGNPALRNSLGFVLGFTLVFVLLGAAASTLGVFVFQHAALFQIIGGIILVLFGLNYAGILKLDFLNIARRPGFDPSNLGFFSAVLFGVVFSIGWTPCVGAFLGSALMLAASSGTMIKGIILLLVYSLGLGIPFVLSAVLLDKLKGTFDFIKRHYRVINLISGGLLIVMGLMMMTGRLNALLSLLTF